MITSNNYFNPEGCEILDEKMWELEKNTSGFIDHNRSKYGYAKNTYDLMIQNTWFPTETSIVNEKKSFNNLTTDEQDIYTTTFAHLSFLDSAQENYLIDFRGHVNNSMVKTTLTLQSYQEGIHSWAYAFLLDVVGNSDEVFDLYKTDNILLEKNNAIAEEFAMHINGTTAEDMLLSAVASINLEGNWFMTNFGVGLVLGDKMQGSRDILIQIIRDEVNTHAPFFANIFKTLCRENSFSTSTIDKVYNAMRRAVEIELDYSMKLLHRSPILGINENSLTNTITNFSNSRLKVMGLENIWETQLETNLEKLVKMGGSRLNDTKTNLFEGQVKNYAKNAIDMNF